MFNFYPVLVTGMSHLIFVFCFKKRYKCICFVIDCITWQNIIWGSIIIIARSRHIMFPGGWTIIFNKMFIGGLGNSIEKFLNVRLFQKKSSWTGLGFEQTNFFYQNDSSFDYFQFCSFDFTLFCFHTMDSRHLAFTFFIGWFNKKS